MLHVLIQDQRVSIDPDEAQPCSGFSSCLLVEGHKPVKCGSVWHETWDDCCLGLENCTQKWRRRAPSSRGGSTPCVTKQRRT